MTTDTIAVIVGEIERIEASAIRGAMAETLGDLNPTQQRKLQAALNRLASQLRSVADRLAALGDVEKDAARAERWKTIAEAGVEACDMYKQIVADRDATIAAVRALADSWLSKFSDDDVYDCAEMILGVLNEAAQVAAIKESGR